MASEPEPLTSSFAVTHAMLLNVLGPARRSVPRRAPAARGQPRAAGQPAAAHPARYRHLPRALAGGVVVEVDPPDGRAALRRDGRPAADFALNQPLSPFAVAALELLDRESPTYSHDVLSVLEATLEDPRQVLSAQRSAARGEAVAAMKAEGIEYEERMELLEDVTYPRPLEDLLGHAFETYRRGHPWVARLRAQTEVGGTRPVRARDDVRGVRRLLRAGPVRGPVAALPGRRFKALRQTVPDALRTDELRDLTEWLGELVRQVDSSLLDEWERLDRGSRPGRRAVAGRDDRPPPVTANVRAFRVLVRNALFRRVELAALRRYDELGELDAESGWDAEAWADAMAAYCAEHDDDRHRRRTRADRRCLMIDEEPTRWLVRQMFDDPAGDHDWGISAEVDLAASDEAGVAVVRVTAVDRLDGAWLP